MWREEGIKGLYRGYILYLLAVRLASYHRIVDFLGFDYDPCDCRVNDVEDSLLRPLRGQLRLVQRGDGQERREEKEENHTGQMS